MNKDQQYINQISLMAGVVGQVGCVVVLIIGLALGAGMLLDQFLDTRAIFTVLLMVASVPVALYVTVRITMLALARSQKKLDEANDTQSEEKTDA